MSEPEPHNPDSSPTFPLGPRKSALPEGTNLGRFRVIRLAGKGGMGEVYQAWDCLLERHVALKSVNSAPSETEYLERFRREAMALAQLSHPNVCQVFDLLTIGSEAFIAMEWLEGVMLDAAAPGMDGRRKLEALRAVAEGLAAAHDKNLVHRDLKPSNLMVDTQGRVKILDFGLARLGSFSVDTPVAVQDPLSSGRQATLASLLKADEFSTAFTPFKAPIPGASTQDRLTHQGVFMGSPRYASPEQIRGELAGTPSDIWSLGVVACELLLGRNPFPGEGVSRLTAIVEGQRESLRGKGASRRICRMLEAMLSLDPGRRPTASGVAHLLSRELHPNRNAWWLTALGGTAAVALLGAYALFGRGVVADLTRQSPARLAIYPVENQTGSDRLTALTRLTLPEFLSAGLRNSEKLEVLDPEELQKAAKRLHLDVSGGYRSEQKEAVARAAGAGLYLSCTLGLAVPGEASLTTELRDQGGRLRHTCRTSVRTSREGLEKACLLLADQTARELARAVDPLGAARTPSLPNLDADSLERYAQGQALMERGDFLGATPHFQAVATQYPGFAGAVKGYARCLGHSSEQSVEPIFMWARMAARAQGDRKEEILILQYLSSHLLDRGQKDRALALCQEGLRMAEPLRLPGLTGTFYNEMGAIKLNQHHVAEAEDCYQKSIRLLQDAGDPQALSRVLNNLGVLEKSQGKLALAEMHYQGLLETARRMGDRWGEGVALNNLGELCLLRRKHDEAADFLMQAVRVRRAIKDETGLTYTYINLAGLDQAKGQWERALEKETMALEITRRLGLKPLEGLCLYNLGELDRAAGHFDQARSAYQASFTIHKALADADMQAHALAGEAECLARANSRNLSQARSLMTQSTALMKDDTPYTLRAKAWILRVEGHPETSSALFQKALEAARGAAPELLLELEQTLRG